VRIPEGVTGLRTKGGKYVGLVDSGTHILLPSTTVTHLVTRREIPYEVPVIDAPTKDNVRATLDALITFNISDPYRFVYSISASDFDHVFQAACQYALRALVRQITADAVNDLIQMDTTALRAALSKDVEPYGVTITRTTITYARPPEDFLRSQEARQLAVLQREEQAEQQQLAQRRLAAEQALELQKIVAQVEREREHLKAEMQEAQMHCQVAEVEARALDLRLGGLEAALRRYPLAAQWETQTAELEVARALAGNARSVLQIGSADDIVRAFTVREFLAQSDKSDTTHPEPEKELQTGPGPQA
jgi:regulator of protease activity HflC (stomatin/prohibitin superfamily)